MPGGPEPNRLQLPGGRSEGSTRLSRRVLLLRNPWQRRQLEEVLLEYQQQRAGPFEPTAVVHSDHSPGPQGRRDGCGGPPGHEELARARGRPEVYQSLNQAIASHCTIG